MTMITHINLENSETEVYCCLRNRIIRLDDQHKHQFCAGCKMFRGEAGGRGVECRWDDPRNLPDPYVVTSPQDEWQSNQERKIQLHGMIDTTSQRTEETKAG
ncbi:hypothetical protein [Gorillibacterium massiliense]|uniref:hypothetical protein n=1 Tax=Gorillibacterium massiliense TaxID=1280390 RepID=UPI0004B93585|nr:hypothetical protein [Gorillibacterium massiliense]